MSSLTFAVGTKPLPLADVGHVFRGAFFDRCGIIERWTTRILLVDTAPKSSKYLFGQKLAAVRALAEAPPKAGAKTALKNPKRVLELLDRFHPYAEMRASLGHAIQTVAFGCDGEPLFIYEPVGRGKALAIVLTAASQQRILSAVSALAKDFTDQRLR